MYLVFQRKLAHICDELYDGIRIRIVKQHSVHLVEGLISAQVHSIIFGDVAAGMVARGIVSGVGAANPRAEDVLLLPLTLELLRVNRRSVCFATIVSNTLFVQKAHTCQNTPFCSKST